MSGELATVRRIGRPPRAAHLRFADKYEIAENGCWLWTAATEQRGYGRFRGGGHNYAHRFAYEHFVGPIPPGMTLDHLCRTPSCVNPAHLEPVTCRENLLRSPYTWASINAAKTSCPEGHRYTVLEQRRTGQARVCGICKSAQRRRRMAA